MASVKDERFWPCPPVPTKRRDTFDHPVMEKLMPTGPWVPIWLANHLRALCICAEPLREGDIVEPCPVHGWGTH